MNKNKPGGALLTFAILQSVYIFIFFATFPSSLRRALHETHSWNEVLSNYIAVFAMVVYCVLGVTLVVQLILRQHTFLRNFLIAGGTAIVSNLCIFLLRLGSYDYDWADSSWGLMLAALFWTAGWILYFARSSRVYSYMGDSPTYLHKTYILRNVEVPQPMPSQDIPRNYPTNMGARVPQPAPPIINDWRRGSTYNTPQYSPAPVNFSPVQPSGYVQSVAQYPVSTQQVSVDTMPGQTIDSNKPIDNSVSQGGTQEGQGYQNYNQAGRDGQ